MMDVLQKKYTNYFVKPFLKWYLKKERVCSVNGFKLKVSPGVFHPAYFFSSTFFSEFISTLNLKNKKFLDIGCGSGILSLSAFKNGAHVTALDINLSAVENTRENFKSNFHNKANEVLVLKSDLFGSLEKSQFDVIVINPPYFFKEANNDMEKAWNCGQNGEYFKELFSKLRDYCSPNANVLMILAENCDITRIMKIANENRIELELQEEKKIKWEANYIYKLKLAGK